MIAHELKTDPEVFDAVASGEKTHEIRYNDRNFQIGDELLLRKTRHTGDQMREHGWPLEYVGEPITRTVSHVLEGYGLMPGWVILSFASGVKPTDEAAIELALGYIEHRIGKSDEEVTDVMREAMRELLRHVSGVPEVPRG